MSNCPKTKDKKAETLTAKYGVNHFSKTQDYKTKTQKTKEKPVALAS